MVRVGFARGTLSGFSDSYELIGSIRPNIYGEFCGKDCAADSLGELLSAIRRSINFSDVGELDIWERLAENPVLRESRIYTTGLFRPWPLREFLNTKEAFLYYTFLAETRIRDSTHAAHIGYLPSGGDRFLDDAPTDGFRSVPIPGRTSLEPAEIRSLVGFFRH